ncbi:cysteine proteinase [Lojkania enalia]|uniref:Cysteine proteinase n=1 Tax=Lojkania enalia TaxID=147567 RepID=A0A9P4K3Y7_9PLEO|nr:cysteine proteinase [Didymosphaeria enalia]
MPGPSGWAPSPNHPKDLIYSAPSGLQIKERVDLRETHRMFHQAYDQFGGTNSCTANAIAAALKYGENAEACCEKGMQDYNPSRNFIWYHERIMNVTEYPVLPKDEISKIFNQTIPELLAEDGITKFKRQDVEDEVKKDGTTWARYGFRALKKFGVCSEDTWKYEDPNTNPAFWNMPSTAMDEALKYIDPFFSYHRINDLYDYAIGQGGTKVINDIEAALCEGFSVVFGCWFPYNHDSIEYQGTTTKEWGLSQDYVYEGWLRDNGERKWGHQMLITGYDRTKQLFLVLNSYGTRWGKDGYFYMPYKWFVEGNGRFVEDPAQSTVPEKPRVDDIWVIKSPRASKC